MSDIKIYNEMFDYLSTTELPESPEPLVVFGRNDALVAHAAGDLAIAGLAEVVVITGGVGKDTGDLLKRGYRSEAHYLADELTTDAAKRGYALPEVHLDEKARHGGENARHSLDILVAEGYPTVSMTAVAHATSARRLAETLKFNGGVKLGETPTVHIKPTVYNFNAKNPIDQKEATAEFLRLVDGPAKGMLGEQPDLPQKLLDFTADKAGKTPAEPSRLALAVFSKLPPSLKQAAIRVANRRNG